jgi:hypothetical protein
VIGSAPCRSLPRRVGGAVALFVAVAVGGKAAAECTLPDRAGTALNDGTVGLAWQAVPAPIEVSRPFQLQVRLCPSQARLLRVDATMPEHRHGMNYRPSVRALGGDLWQVDGMLWHMSGRWELRFDVASDDREHTLRQSVTLW